MKSLGGWIGLGLATLGVVDFAVGLRASLADGEAAFATLPFGVWRWPVLIVAGALFSWTQRRR